ncbi:MAG: hypothetical protein JWO46_817, partial [Nocardioidaceae bacterium]|nr:hypothetical protein [Nocardioidaceae bacterium]
DNGPGYLVHDANAMLYERLFLSSCQRLLRPGGALVVWSAAEASALEDAMRDVFGSVEPRPFAVDLQGRSEHYWLYLARVRADSGPAPG